MLSLYPFQCCHWALQIITEPNQKDGQTWQEGRSEPRHLKIISNQAMFQVRSTCVLNCSPRRSVSLYNQGSCLVLIGEGKSGKAWGLKRKRKAKKCKEIRHTRRNSKGRLSLAINPSHVKWPKNGSKQQQQNVQDSQGRNYTYHSAKLLDSNPLFRGSI